MVGSGALSVSVWRGLKAMEKAQCAPWIFIHGWVGVLSNMPLPAPNRPQPWAR